MPVGLTKDIVVAVFAGVFGEPTKRLKKIVGWRFEPGIDLVVQLDSRLAAEQVYVWIPAAEGNITTIDCPCDLYAAGKTRHHNVARFKSLAASRWAIRFRPRTVADVGHLAKAFAQVWNARRTGVKGTGVTGRH